MKRTGLNDDNGDLHKVGTYLGVARLPLSPPDAERNKPWPEKIVRLCPPPVLQRRTKNAPVQTAFNARVQEKNEFVIRSCSWLKTTFCPTSVRV